MKDRLSLLDYLTVAVFAVQAGFALLTLALVSGAFFIENLFAQHLVHKVALAIVAWVVFGVLLLGRWRFGWRGRKALHWVLAGFVLHGLSYFGAKLVLEDLIKKYPDSAEAKRAQAYLKSGN